MKEWCEEHPATTVVRFYLYVYNLSGFGEAMPENEIYLQTGAPTILQ